MFWRLVFEDGTVVGFGGHREDNVRKCTLTQCVNAQKELMPGSVCCASLEAEVQMERKPLAGERVTLYSVGDGVEPVQVGVFTLVKPTRSSRLLYRLEAYDHVRKLDRDLSQWLAALSGWPYTLKDFARMVAGACGVELMEGQLPNGDLVVRKFYQAGATGRQILQWVGELACRFLYAGADGKLRFGWYAERGGQVTPTGDHYYFAGALSYEDYEVAAVDAVKLRLAGTDGGLLWPEGAAENPYVMVGNPIALANVDTSMPSHLEVIRQQLAALPAYRPCRVSVPASRDVRVGDVLTAQDIYGVRFKTLVMTRTVSGQRQTLECVGSRVRGDVVTDRRTPGQIAQDTVDRQSQKDVFKKLTDNGKAQGLFLGEDGDLYINASYLATGILASKDGSSFYLDLDKGILKMKATELQIEGQTVDQIAQGKADAAVDAQTQMDIFNKLTKNQTLEGLFMRDGQLYVNATWVSTGVLSSKDGTVEVDLGNNCVKIHGKRDGFETELRLSSEGVEGYGENEDGTLEHTLSLGVGVSGNPTSFWNPSWQGNTGLTLGAAAGQVWLGESTAAVKVFGSSVDIGTVLGDSLKILGKDVHWEDMGGGRYMLVGT